MPTITAGGLHLGEVRSALAEVNNDEVVEKGRAVARFVEAYTGREMPEIIMVNGMALVDIGMRMLEPHELFRAQGFDPDTYIHGRGADGRKITKTKQVQLCGNSVPPQFLEAIGNANYPLSGVARFIKRCVGQKQAPGRKEAKTNKTPTLLSGAPHTGGETALPSGQCS